MENKSICYYCGTVYDNELEKCPLCGSTVKANEEEIQRPAPRRRLTEQERKERQRASKGKYAGEKKKNTNKTRPILIAAMVFLVLAVIVVFYFIGDMIGWWPGLEDTIERYQASVALEKSCQELIVEPEEVNFKAPGKTMEFTVSVNASCEEIVSCVVADQSIISISQEAVTEEGEELKSATFTLVALSAGETEINVTCGDKSFSCPVLVIDPDTFAPTLDCGAEISMPAFESTKQLNVPNLPEGKIVTWTSEDEDVATVDANGLVTATGRGETLITAEVNGNTAQVIVHCDFEMPIDEGAKINLADVTLKVGEKFRLSLVGSDGERITDGVSYTVKHPEICEVEDGYVKGLKKGTTKVIITYGEKEFECIVRVTR